MRPTFDRCSHARYAVKVLLPSGAVQTFMHAANCPVALTLRMSTVKQLAARYPGRVWLEAA